MQQKSRLNRSICNISSNVYWLFVVLTLLLFNRTHGILLNKLNFNPITNVRPKLSYITLNCKINKDSKLWANKISRSSPEMDLIKSTVNNPSSDLGPLSKYIDVPNMYYYKEMEEFLKRGFQMNKIKKFFYSPKTPLSEYTHREQIHIPYFRDPTPIMIGGVSKKPKEPKLIGRDIELYKDGEIALEKGKYTLEDVMCQELISALLKTEQITNPKSPLIMVPKEDIFEEIKELEKNNDPEAEELKEFIEDSLVTDKYHLPINLNKYNREYLEGLKQITKSGLDFPQVLDNYNLQYINKENEFLAKLMTNIRLLIQITNNVDLSTLYSKMLKPLEQNEEGFGKWTEYLNTPLLSHMYKYSKLEKPGDVDKLPELDVKSDLMQIFMDLIKTKYHSNRRTKELEKLRNEYIEFSLNRRKGPKLFRKMMPFWIWHDFWRNREEFFHENMIDLLKDIVIADPKVDLREVLKGTIEQFYRAFVPPTISKRGTGRILDSVIEADNKINNSNIKKIVDLMNDYSHSTKSKVVLRKGRQDESKTEKDSEVSVINLDEVIDKIVELKNRNWKDGKNDQFIKMAEVVEELDDSPDKRWKREIIERDAEDLEVKPFGYNFKDILSFDKFEEAYKKFNLKNFGTEDYNLYKGQLVRGKVVHVTRTEVSVDIHAFALGILKLNRYYDTPSEVPLGGFKRIFKAGDELMFEVSEIWDDKIILSLKNIKQFHKFKNILEHRDKGHIFYAKILQTYTKGVLVKYVPKSEVEKESHEPVTEDSTEQQQNNKLETEEDPPEIGWIPRVKMSKMYRDSKRIFKPNMIGKIIPVMFDSYDSLHKIPILSNKDAIRKMQIIHLKKGDIIKGGIKLYKPYLVALRFGTLTGVLHVDDMNDEDYRQHLIDCPSSLVCKVKYIDPHRNLIFLTSKDMYDLKDSDLKDTNLFQAIQNRLPLSESMKLYNDFIDRHRSKDGSTKPPSIYTHEDYKYSVDPESKSIHVRLNYLNDSPKSEETKSVQTTTEQTSTNTNQSSQDKDFQQKQQEQFYDESVLIHKSRKDPKDSFVEWQFDGEKLIDDPKLLHGYNRHSWLIDFGNWFELPSDVQNTLNYQFNNNNQIGYFLFKGDKYRILFDKNLAISMKKGHPNIFRIKRLGSKFL